MDTDVLPLLLFLGFAAAMSVAMLVLGKLVGPSRTTAVKEMPYESGMDPIHDSHRRFNVRFHLVAIAFLVFDVELLFLYPWAVAARDGIDTAVAAQLVSARLVVWHRLRLLSCRFAPRFVRRPPSLRSPVS